MLKYPWVRYWTPRCSSVRALRWAGDFLYSFLHFSGMCSFINQLTMASICPFVSISKRRKRDTKPPGIRVMIRSHGGVHTSPAMHCDASCSDTGRASKMADHSKPQRAVWQCGPLQNHKLMSEPDSMKAVMDCITLNVLEPLLWCWHQTLMPWHVLSCISTITMRTFCKANSKTAESRK